MLNEIIKKEYEKYLNMVLEIDSKKVDTIHDIFKSKLCVPTFKEEEIDYILEKNLKKYYSEGYFLVGIGNGVNYMSVEEYKKHGLSGKTISNLGFASGELFHEDYAEVKIIDSPHTIAQCELWNLIDKQGNLVSKDWFKSVSYFCNGFATVTKPHYYLSNFLKEDGTLLLDKWYNFLYNFKDGYAVVCDHKKRNFVDCEGNFISDVWYDDAKSFSCGYARVEKDERWNFIDEKGTLLSCDWYQYVDDFCNGFARVQVGAQWNYINREGRKILQNDCAKAYNFREGYAIILDCDDNFCVINQEGKTVFMTDQYDSVILMNSKMIKVEKSSKWNCMDFKGNLLSDVWFDLIDVFKEGYAKVARKDKFNEMQWNYIDLKGNLLSDVWYQDIDYFENGYALVRTGEDRYNFIDTHGNLFLKEDTSKPENFRNGYFRVEQNGKYNFIDKNGNLVSTWQICLDYFYGDYAIVKRNEQYNYINKKGEYVLKDWITDIKVLKNGYRLEQQENLLYLLDKDRNYLYQTTLPKNFVCAINFLKKLPWKEITIDPTKVEKTLLGYRFQENHFLKYEPVRDFEYFVLCKKMNFYYLYDKRKKNVQFLCDGNQFSHGENYITYNERTFFISDNIIEVTGIFPKRSLQLKVGVKEVLTIEDFQKKYISKDFYNQLKKELEEQKERLKQERLGLIKQMSKEEIELRRQELEEQLKTEEVEGKIKKEVLEKKKLYYLRMVAQITQQLLSFEQDDSFKTIKKTEKITEDALFEWVDDHKEIRKEFLVCNMLRHYDLAYISFDHVKVSGIDLSYTNAEINPQTVYNKDMSEGNYSGLNFTLKDFTGVFLENSIFDDCIFDFANQKKKDYPNH